MANWNNNLQRFEQLIQRVSSSLAAAGLKTEDILATLPVARDRVYKRQYDEPNSESD